MNEELSEAFQNKIASLKSLTLLVYLLYAFSYFTFGITALIAIAINYWKLEEVNETWLGSHFSSQISIFWHCFLWVLMGWLTMILYVGYFVFIASFIWMLYRVTKGLKCLLADKAMPD